MLQNVQNNDSIVPAEKTIALASARNEFSQLIEGIQIRQESYILQKNGKDVAAIVPVYILRSWRKQRMARLAAIDLIQQQTSKLKLNEEELDTLIKDAIREVREENALKSEK